MKRVMTIVTIVFAVLLAASVSSGQERDGNDQKRYFYQWTDDRGVVHITDSLQNVPDKYRSRARKSEAREAEEPAEAGQQPATPPEAPPAVDEEAQRELWQGRMRQAKRHLAEAEQRYQDLVKQRDEIMSKWGVGVYAPPQDVLDEIKRIEDEMDEAQRGIDEARNQVEEVIPDEARRAGVPPGWIRE
jgi:type IV secretory pathway VirB10-like protein